ncbi:MAG: amidohydrolase family protein [Alphaproteobacteria bacterium]|nr:amidohydrolase family protein [Alphaproteobacteria bacterium]
MHDLVIRGGTLVDGTGRAPFVGDLAIDGDRIVAVGVVEGRGRREIDATGKLVTPGFVDMHTHYDGQVSWDPHFTPSGWHGCTTVIMGNCGVGFAPCRREDREWLINVMEGVEDIPGSALAEGIDWEWETFPEYLDAIERKPHSLDFAAQVPHSAVRGFVLGRDASEDRDATPDEIARMKEVVAEGLRAGALGFSTSRTSLHKTAAGKLVAGTFAAKDELFGIGEALAETGLGVFECANEHVTLDKDIEWMIELTKRIDRPVIFNLSQTDFAPELWKKVLARLESAVAEGADLWAQSAGRSIGILMNWRCTAHPFALHPRWQALATLPWEEQLAALRDPATKAAILADTPEERGVFEAYVTRTFEKMYALSATGYEPDPTTSLAARARATGVSPAELAYDEMLADDGRGFLYFPLFNYADGDLSPLHTLHDHPRVLMGLSDGGAHCGAICDAGMPTFMLTHWTRDRERGPTFPIERIVHRQTQQTAAFYGLLDRGVLAPGYKADVNVIDYASLSLDAPALTFDLPAGGRRLVQDAKGYVATVCSGVVTFEGGAPTGAMPGKLLRGPRSAPEVRA